MTRINRVLDLEQIDRDIFRGPVIESTLLRTFGGQVAAQALVAASRTVDGDFSVHSLHGYFVAGGRSDEPTIFLVDRVRDGRSFRSRQVRAIQDGETLFIMSASFHRSGDLGVEHADRMPEVPGPENIVMDVSGMRESFRALLEEWSDFDIRVVDPADYPANPHAASQQVVWLRSRAPLPEDETAHVCTLAYMSDMTLLQSALVPHPGVEVQEASLDHAMWFLRPFRADEWLLYDQVSPSASAGRALTHGRIFDRSGNLVAVVTQEGLTRTLRPGAQSIPLSTSVRRERTSQR
ncbi:acyl-CoA thioesterase [Corynebacterium pygosceleis]|uniref:Acyl-CoA thioesterase 2 n=1 Tax=Corynebacterium pygosceleis TaxID=2800406 RepID=A0A9Q4GI05_9CORY|nr:acyl-CoA thioesterase II [Corynebacterium pygosceleis]MCK7636923.1 acyl-CoA thioesterase II [Corynebacterium pygosceleis]MCK7674397.1 acyl-CoA thioesterase II [Corynebacterium pygosceleis]MCL0120305.1 acyl-CoA thioesterase II [Corynebacterium pygosceleis]MCX7467676.1 acyl-CoA thioesterase II [Corynebacterium pygosceleis]